MTSPTANGVVNPVFRMIGTSNVCTQHHDNKKRVTVQINIDLSLQPYVPPGHPVNVLVRIKFDLLCTDVYSFLVRDQ